MCFVFIGERWQVTFALKFYRDVTSLVGVYSHWHSLGPQKRARLKIVRRPTVCFYCGRCRHSFLGTILYVHFCTDSVDGAAWFRIAVCRL